MQAKRITVENLIPTDLPVIAAERDKFHRLFELLLKEELASSPRRAKLPLPRKRLLPR